MSAVLSPKNQVWLKHPGTFCNCAVKFIVAPVPPLELLKVTIGDGVGAGGGGGPPAGGGVGETVGEGVGVGVGAAPPLLYGGI